MSLQKPLDSPRERGFLLQLALPDDAHAPLLATQSRDVPKIASAVFSELWHPEAALRFRQPRERAARMAVPITAVDEDDLSEFGENEVRLSGKIACVEPKCMSE